MTKRGVIYCILSLALAIYLLVGLKLSAKMAREAACKGVIINVANNDMARFVTADDISYELDSIVEHAPSMRASQIALQSIEDRLLALPIIETANCYRRNDNSIYIDVVPVVPVARVFAPNGSYYINKAGKRLPAQIRYHLDVPVITLADSLADPTMVLSLIRSIAASRERTQLVAAIKIDRNGDIILTPNIVGHVINFGDTTMVNNKFDRLFTFYRKVMPVRGWNYYDTISVKYDKQVVATVIPGKRRKQVNKDADYEFIEDLVGANVADDSIAQANLSIIKSRL